MAQRSPTEKFVKYSTTVDTMPDAWLFVMDHIDKVGGRASVEIRPISSVTIDHEPWHRSDEEPGEWQHYYEVTVYGSDADKEDGDAT